MGIDRPSPDHANADVIFLISAHLESGHYFNPHAQRIIEGKHAGAKIIVVDVRLSNTATHADYWLAPHPGSEAAMLLAISNYLIQNGPLQPRVRTPLVELGRISDAERPGVEPRFEDFENPLARVVCRLHVRVRRGRGGGRCADAARRRRRRRGRRLRASRRTTGGRQQPGTSAAGRFHACLFLLNALLGAIAVEGGVYPNAWNKFVPKPIYSPPHPKTWNNLTWPGEYPLAMHEMSILLPHLLAEGRGKLDVYFSRVYNPVWTNPDGFAWIEALSDSVESRPACRVDADLERVGVFRRLCSPDGPRIGTP